MAGKGADPPPSDAVLVAYLDGELEPEAHREIGRLTRGNKALRDRMTVLAQGGRPFRAAFDALLDQAPRNRLAAMVPAPTGRPTQVRHGGFRRALQAIAASLLLLMAGGAAGFFAARAPETFLVGFGDWDEWRETVARQISLYGPETVMAAQVDQAAQAAELRRLQALLRLDLPLARVTVPGLVLKRAELLRVDDRPLAQLLYQSDALGPVAFCITAEAEAEEGRTAERRAGMSLVYWTDGHHGYLLVSAAPAEQLEAIADILAQRFSS